MRPHRSTIFWSLLFWLIIITCNDIQAGLTAKNLCHFFQKGQVITTVLTPIRGNQFLLLNGGRGFRVPLNRFQDDSAKPTLNLYQQDIYEPPGFQGPGIDSPFTNPTGYYHSLKQHYLGTLSSDGQIFTRYNMDPNSGLVNLTLMEAISFDDYRKALFTSLDDEQSFWMFNFYQKKLILFRMKMDEEPGKIRFIPDDSINPIDWSTDHLKLHGGFVYRRTANVEVVYTFSNLENSIIILRRNRKSFKMNETRVPFKDFFVCDQPMPNEPTGKGPTAVPVTGRSWDLTRPSSATTAESLKQILIIGFLALAGLIFCLGGCLFLLQTRKTSTANRKRNGKWPKYRWAWWAKGGRSSLKQPASSGTASTVSISPTKSLPGRPVQSSKTTTSSTSQVSKTPGFSSAVTARSFSKVQSTTTAAKTVPSPRQIGGGGSSSGSPSKISSAVVSRSKVGSSKSKNIWRSKVASSSQGKGN